MSADLQDLEIELRGLRPKALDPRFLDRLCASADGTWCRESPSEEALSQSLAELPAAPLPPHLMAALERTVSGVPFPADRKILRFPHPAAASPRRRGLHVAAAAVVALCGALTALMVPADNSQSGPLAAGGRRPAASEARPAPASKSAAIDLVPAAFRRGLSEATDQGVIVRPGHQAHRVLRVVYRDRVTMCDKTGRIYQMEEPRVEYILVPARID